MPTRAADVIFDQRPLPTNYIQGFINGPPANNADADRLVRGRRRHIRQARPLRIGGRHDAGHHGAVARLQRTVVAALIGEKERLGTADRLGVAHCRTGRRLRAGAPAFEKAGQGFELCCVARAAAFQLGLVVAHDRQLGDGGAQLQRGIVRKKCQRGLIAGQCLIAVAVVGQDRAELDMRLDLPGVELDRATQEFHTLLRPPAGDAAQADTEIKAGGDIVRCKRERGPQARDRLLVAAGAVQHAAERAMRGRELRIEPRGALGEGDGGCGIAALPERHAEMDMRHGMARHEGDDAAEAIHGGVEPFRSGRAERGSEAKIERPAVGIARARGLELRNAFAPEALPAERVAQRSARGGEVRIKPDGGAQMLDGGSHVAAMTEQPSELVEGAAKLGRVDWQAQGLDGFGRPDGESSQSS